MTLVKGFFSLCMATCFYMTLTGVARPYTLEYMDKWGPPYFPGNPGSCVSSGQAGVASAATITWSYITDGAGFSTAQTTPPFTTGSTSNLYAGVRAAMDAKYGTGAFDRAVNNAFAAWSSVAGVNFAQKSDNGAPFAGTYAINVRIGAYPFSGGSDVGGVGYGPPCDAVDYMADYLAGDIAFSAGNNFQIATGNDGDALPLINNSYSNDIESLMLHEIGHAIGLGHSTDPHAVMCGYVDANNTGSNCSLAGNSYEVIHRKLQPDDIAGAQFLYGAPAAASTSSDGPIPLWADIALGLSLIAIVAGHQRRKDAAR